MRLSKRSSTFSVNIFIVSFISVYCSQMFWYELPDLNLILLCFLVLAMTAYCTRNMSAPLGILLAVIWSSSVGYWHMHWQLQDVQFQQEVVIVGQITEVNQNQQRTRIIVAAKQVGKQHFIVARKLRLNWYRSSTKLMVGDRVSLVAKLKPPHGLANPFGFNYERWLLSKAIVAVGNVVVKHAVTVTPKQLTLRDTLISDFKKYELAQQRWLLSLGFGERNELTQQDWLLLQLSGLSHLFAISGLHLGSVAAVLWFALSKSTFVIGELPLASKYFYKSRQYNFNTLILLIIVVACTGYAYLANWQIPVFRAWVMLTMGLGFSVLRIRTNLWQLTSIVFMILIITMPLSIYSNSLWLSIIAVLVIAFFVWRWPLSEKGFFGYLVSLIRLQLLFSTLMLPLIISQFGNVSFIAIVLNLIVVPLIALIIVPGCLIALLLMLLNVSLDYYLFVMIDSFIGIIISVVDVVVANEKLFLQGIYLSTLSLTSLSLAIFLLWLPRFNCQNRAAFLIAMPLIFELFGLNGKETNWEVHVIDVGQGTSVLVTQNQHALLVDTGASFPSGFSMGEAAVLPMIRGFDIDALDYMIISHADNDHAGSSAVIADNVVVKKTIDYNECRQGQHVQWHRLSIQFLWPTNEYQGKSGLSENNRSCVVKISDGNRSALFSGDIEKLAETLLVESIQSNTELELSADVLLAPHHGSKTSSSLLFLKQVAPQYAVFTAGYLNRWKFPHIEVSQRYQRLGVEQWNSAESGYIRFNIPYDPQTPIVVNGWRQDLHKRWFMARTKL